MKIKFHVVAGLVTIIFAVALFFVMGGPGLGPGPDEALVASAQPEFMQVPAGQMDSANPQFSEESNLERQVLDLYIDDSSVWIATPAGLIRADRNSREYQLIDSADGVDPTTLTSIVRIGNRTLFCTDNAMYEQAVLRVFHRVDLPMTPPIVSSVTSESTSVVGSCQDGVLAATPTGTMPLKSDIAVTAIVRAPDGFWVGTNGDGLWFFNGEKWQQRFLRNDTVAFDWVTALAYRWPNLWVGTTDGLYRYDGGRWDTYTTSDSGYTGGWVTDLAFSGSRLYIGTADRGLWTYDGTDFSTVHQLPDSSITRIKVHRHDVYVGTQSSGVFVLRAGKWRPLLPTHDVPDSLPRQWTLL